jgi:hypothetical protein
LVGRSRDVTVHETGDNGLLETICTASVQEPANNRRHPADGLAPD